MFKIVDQLTFWWPVKVKEPDPEKPGEFAEYEFQIKFEMMDREQVEAFEKKREKLINDAANSEKPKKVRELRQALIALEDEEFGRAIKDWRDVVGDDNKPIPFSKSVLAQALSRGYVRRAIADAYREAIQEDGGRLGN